MWSAMPVLNSKSIFRRANALFFLFTLALFANWPAASAQTLNWEGQTGIFITPLAYVAPSSDKGFGMPVVAYHYLNGGNVLGGFHQLSVTDAAFHRLEFGYTRSFHQSGSTSGLSPLWGDGFNVFHEKLNFLNENSAGISWMPAVSVGFVVRSQVQNVGGVIQGRDTTNSDFYVVATKTVSKVRQLPMVFNFGVKATNASLLGLAGNAPGYSGRFFGSAAFVVKGPARSSVFFAAEALQEPRHVEGLPTAIIPTTLAYAVRIVPAGAFPSIHHGWGEESPRLNFDIGVAQAAGAIMPGVNLNVRHQLAIGASYQF
jgi:hypothetical protein